MICYPPISNTTVLCLELPNLLHLVHWIIERLDELRTFARMVVIGIVSNGAGYVAYLGLANVGVDPKIAMTIMYAVGTCIGFVGNRRWSFAHNEAISAAALKYVIVYLIGYGFNWVILRYFVDELNYPHALVQGAVMAVLVVYFFLTMRLFVFPLPRSPRQGP